MRRNKNSKVGRRIVRTAIWPIPDQDDAFSDETVTSELSPVRSSDHNEEHKSLSLYIKMLINKLTRRIQR